MGKCPCNKQEANLSNLARRISKFTITPLHNFHLFPQLSIGQEALDFPLHRWEKRHTKGYSTKVNMWREVQNDGQQIGAEHEQKESFVGKRRNYKDKCSKELEAVTQVERVETHKELKRQHSSGIKAGNETCSRDTKRKEGLQEEEVFAHFSWRVKRVHEHTWRSAADDRLLKPTSPSNPLVHINWLLSHAMRLCCSFRLRLWNEESCSLRWSSVLYPVGGCWSAVMHCEVFVFTGVPTP